LRIALNAFVDETQKTVTGTAKIRLYKGNVAIAGRTSPFSLYNARLATYTKEDTFDHTAAEGFIKIYGLALKTYHEVQSKAGAGQNNHRPRARKPQPVQ
jgi:argininosuccinate synthase